MITVSSIFRNAVPYIPRYFEQIEELRRQIPVRLVIGYGDCVDETAMLLNRYTKPDDIVLNVDHGGPVFGSCDSEQRWRQIAQVVRGVIKEIDDPGTHYVWVEGDLIWDAKAIMRLVQAGRPVAPMVFIWDNPAQTWPRFYDSWGFRQNGDMFAMYPPYFPHGQTPERYQKIDSCGSCFSLPKTDFHMAKLWDGMWPFTAQGELWVDTETSVRHP